MTSNYQDRIFLNLMDDNAEAFLVKDILKSPLGLASKIIEHLFSESFDSLQDSLDNIKDFAAGITRAKKLSSNYTLASYYSMMFSFHQYVQSSYRARQGKVLEKVLQNIIINYSRCDITPEKTKEMLSVLNQIIGAELPILDIDAMGVDSARRKAIIIQLRSRDDTGGTTAKESLVELLRAILRTDKVPNKDILYLVCVWDARNSQQKNSTIEKMYSSLRDHISVNKEAFSDDICDGVKLEENIKLKLSYGTDEIANSIFEWTGGNDYKTLGAIVEIIRLIENWDDLWVSYALASLEIEVMSLLGYSNVRLLNEKFEKVYAKFDFGSYQHLTQSIDRTLGKIIPLWIEKSIPLPSLCDISHYIRDLLFLKACYEKLSK